VTLPIHLPATRSAAPRLSYILFGALLTSLTVIALAPGLLGPSLDAGVYSLMGGRIASGALPYVDVWDHKPPGLYLVNALGDFISGSAGSWQVAWVISVAALVLTGVVVADTLRRLGWRRSAWIAGAGCALELASFPLARGGGLTETLAVLPAAFALRLVGVGPPTARRTLAAGLGAGIATATSLQAAPVLLAALAVVIVRQYKAGMRPMLLRLAWVVVGAGMVWTALLAVLSTAGATPAAAMALVRYNAAFAQLGGRDDSFVGEALHGILVLSPLAIAALLGLRRSLSSPLLRPMAAGALVWIAASAAFILAQGRLELHYLAPLAVPLSLLLPAGIPGRAHARRLGFARVAMAASLLVAAASVSILLISTETAIGLEVRSRQAARDQSVATWIASHSAVDDSLFVWGNRPQLYSLAQRPPASQYIYLLPLLTPGFTSHQMVSDVVARWQHEPPAVIVDAGSAAPGAAGMPALLVPRSTVVGDHRDLDLLDPIREFVRQRYVVATTLEGWPIYLLREGGSADQAN
jgi:hypothetical protein